MGNALSIRRYIWLRFPEFDAVEISVDGPWQLTLHLVLKPSATRPEELDDALAEIRPATFTLSEKIHASRAAIPEAKIARAWGTTSLPIDVIEDGRINVAGIIDLLMHRWPETAPLLHESRNGVLVIEVSDETDDEVRGDIMRSLSLLTSMKVEVIPRAHTTEPRARTTTGRARQAQHDKEMLWEYSQDAFCGELPAEVISQGTPGEGAYISRWAKNNIFHALSLFEHVYVDVPLTKEESFEQFGVTWDDFTEALPIGRIIPVMILSAERYDDEVVVCIGERAPRVIWNGEFRLRQLDRIGQEHFVARALARGDEEIRDAGFKAMQALSGTDKKLVTDFYSVEAAIADGARRAARHSPHMSTAVAPLAELLSRMVTQMAGLAGERILEIATGLTVRLESSALASTPMIEENEHNKLAQQYLEFVSGVLPGGDVLSPFRVPQPKVMEGLLLSTPDRPIMSLREFALVFRGGAVERMQTIIKNPGLWDERADEIISKFNREVRAVNRSQSPAVSASLLASAIGKFGIPKMLARIPVLLIRSILERIAPLRLDALDSWLTDVPQESVSLARVRRKLT